MVCRLSRGSVSDTVLTASPRSTVLLVPQRGQNCAPAPRLVPQRAQNAVSMASNLCDSKRYDRRKPQRPRGWKAFGGAPRTRATPAGGAANVHWKSEYPPSLTAATPNQYPNG